MVGTLIITKGFEKAAEYERIVILAENENFLAPAKKGTAGYHIVTLPEMLNLVLLFSKRKSTLYCYCLPLQDCLKMY
ncbi:hypothetical protein SAMN04488034_102541 [Salinimicrobium catena]|uniref:Uncharacterized protein n=1 Tax=Salinimicrobium catena TaxID=390640 RepID=A0A1H5M3H7_9FLAO|nr:hypothetical protein SAMN04488140_102541 [Salinimicrobium catena]SEE83856.1 hypothetical protein SAMN04488034_102541 [Salinimicrobium catena]